MGWVMVCLAPADSSLIVSVGINEIEMLAGHRGKKINASLRCSMERSLLFPAEWRVYERFLADKAKFA
jgi:hypothetical protein